MTERQIPPRRKNTKKDIFKEEAKIRLKAIKTRKKKNRKPYQKKRIVVPMVVMAFLLLLGVHSLIVAQSYQSTDDAFVAGHLASVSPKVSGQILKLHFDDNDEVKKGQLLAEIDPKDYQNKVNELENAIKEAEANKDVNSSDIDKSAATLSQADKTLEAAQAKLNFAQRDYDRYAKLKVDGLCTKQQYDGSKTKLDVAKAEFKQAQDNKHAMDAMLKSSKAKETASGANVDKLKAQLAQAKLNLSYTKIYAPQNGTISSKNVELGNFVQVGQPITAVVSEKVWVVANFKETQLTKMQKGQEVTVKVDTFAGKKFKAHVDSIQRASGAQASLFPPENAVGSYVKVVQRIPVKIVFDEDITQFNVVPGMSVVPKVKIK